MMDLRAELADWPVGGADAAVVDADGVIATTGGTTAYAWASVTKIVTALTVLDAAADGVLDLDEPAGPPGATVRQLLGHVSGVAFDTDDRLAKPGTRRIYSNRGYEIAAQRLEERAGEPFERQLRLRVLDPLGMAGTSLDGSPAAGGAGPIEDLSRLAVELLRPAVLPARVVEAATTIAYPGLKGVLPGFGRQNPNDWGLGCEIRDHKRPHWTAAGNSPRTFGHFGQSGSFLWVDPDAGIGCASLADRPFGEWASGLWPRLSERVLAAYAPGR
jgi:CubicO group peptidase (beta-lactamase class C family)